MRAPEAHAGLLLQKSAYLSDEEAVEPAEGKLQELEAVVLNVSRHRVCTQGPPGQRAPGEQSTLRTERIETGFSHKSCTGKREASLAIRGETAKSKACDRQAAQLSWAGGVRRESYRWMGTGRGRHAKAKGEEPGSDRRCVGRARAGGRPGAGYQAVQTYNGPGFHPEAGRGTRSSPPPPEPGTRGGWRTQEATRPCRGTRTPPTGTPSGTGSPGH